MLCYRLWNDINIIFLYVTEMLRKCNTKIPTFIPKICAKNVCREVFRKLVLEISFMSKRVQNEKVCFSEVPAGILILDIYFCPFSIFRPEVWKRAKWPFFIFIDLIMYTLYKMNKSRSGLQKIKGCIFWSFGS